MKKALLSIAVVVVVALAAVVQMQSVRADSNVESPGKPSNVSAEYQGERSISVSWDASPREKTGVRYQVFYRQSGTSAWTDASTPYSRPAGSATYSSNPIAVPTLGKYQVRVRACHFTVGSNTVCDNSAAATVQVGAVPAKPTGLKLKQAAHPNHDIHVTWDAVEDTDNYKIRWRAEDASLGDPMFATTTQATVPLDEYGAWVVRVEACNDAGCGKPASKTITTSILPPKQSGLTVETQKDSLFINVAWHDHGDHQYYILLRKPDEAYLGMRGSSRGGSTLRIKVDGYGDWVVGLQSCWPGISWGYVCRHFPIAEKRVSVEGTTPAGMSNFEVEDVSVRHPAIAVSWDEDPHATRYEIKWRKQGEEFKAGAVRQAPRGTTSVEIKLPKYSHKGWIVQARACNVNLCGPTVSQNDVQVEGITPGFMDNFEVEDVSARSPAIAVSWDEDPHATRYEIKWRERGEEFKPGNILETPHGKTSVKIELPNSYKGWVVRARACSANLCGPAVSQAVAVTIFVEVPQFDEIPNLSVDVKRASLQATAQWDYVRNATYYNVWHSNTTDGGMEHSVVRAATYSFYVPGYGTWDFVAQACNDDRCFAMTHKLLKVDPPEVASPTNLEIAHYRNRIVAVQWDSSHSAGRTLSPEKWQVCWDGSCVDQTDGGGSVKRYRLYPNATISSGGVVTVQGVATYESAQKLSEQASWTAPTVAPPANLRITQASGGSGVVQWDSIYEESSGALKPEGWQLCLDGESCIDRSARQLSGSYDNAAPGATITVRSVATSGSLRIVSDPISVIVPGN